MGEPTADALDRLASALQARGEPSPFRRYRPATGATLEGDFEVRAADGRVRRLQRASLPLPAPLVRAFAHAAPARNVRVDLGTHALTLWSPEELIELQVGYRWHGFNGKRMREWDERYVVLAEDGGDPVALRTDEPDGPVWLSHRGDGRHSFFVAAPSLADFFLALAIWLESAGSSAFAAALRGRFGEAAAELWIWKELVSRTEARR